MRFFPFCVVAVLLIAGIVNSCINETIPAWSNAELSIDEAKYYFNKTFEKDSLEKKPLWPLAIQNKLPQNFNYVVVPLSFQEKLTPILSQGGDESAKNLEDKLTINQLSYLYFYKNKQNKIKCEVVTYIPNDKYYTTLMEAKSLATIKFSGFVLIEDWEKTFISGYNVDEDTIIGELAKNLSPEITHKARIKGNSPCGSVKWMRCVCSMDAANRYQCTCTPYSIQDFYCLYYPNPAGSSTNNVISASSRGSGSLTASPNGGLNSYNISSRTLTFPADPGEIIISDLSKELSCFSAGKNTPDFNYKIVVYVDEPYPSSGSSVTFGGDSGHTWVGFEKVHKKTGLITTRTIGFYPAPDFNTFLVVRGGVKSAIRDNSSHYADVSISYDVTALQFENAVYEARGSATRSYSLENYNCTNYAYDICKAANLTIPNPTTYVAIDGTILKTYSPGGLGFFLRHLNTNAVRLNHFPPKKQGSCN
ncbi:hypothetical protein [Larkinella soli]|uniref:hypothetical protein n=1 Tax=Larkinella soli TaxID=1770527 RepID=UPI000FFC4F5F|nr:hypothetical protein [Larkinella soli]